MLVGMDGSPVTAQSSLEGPVLVTGATGRQGGAVSEHLLRCGHQVRALCRTPGSARAQRLARLGAELVKGDLDDAASLDSALQGAAGVFSVQNFWDPSVGYAGEIRQGRALAEASRRSGVQLFVQSSMADADEDRAPLPRHFQSKKRVETIVDDLGLPYVFLGTVFFMDNIDDRSMGGPMLFPMLAGVLGRDTRLEMLAVSDIGRAAAAVFAAPAKFVGTRIDLVGDVLTVPEMRDVYHRATGRRAWGWGLPGALSRRLNADFIEQLEWQRQVGFKAGPAESRVIVPGLQDLMTHLRLRNQSTNPGATSLDQVARVP
jgi:uncharacterized protein YbjT (DUF2867 family)